MSLTPFDGKPLTPAAARSVQAEITALTAYEAGLFFSLVTGADSPVSALARAAGPLKGVANYIVAAIDAHFPDAAEKARACGELLVEKASSLGLTCRYIRNSYSADRVEVNLRAGQKILFLIALGHNQSK